MALVEHFNLLVWDLLTLFGLNNNSKKYFLIFII